MNVIKTHQSLELKAKKKQNFSRFCYLFTHFLPRVVQLSERRASIRKIAKI